MSVQLNENGTIKEITLALTGLDIKGIELITDSIGWDGAPNTSMTFTNIPLPRPFNEYNFLIMVPRKADTNYGAPSSTEQTTLQFAIWPVCRMLNNNSSNVSLYGKCYMIITWCAGNTAICIDEMTDAVIKKIEFQNTIGRTGLHTNLYGIY